MTQELQCKHTPSYMRRYVKKVVDMANNISREIYDEPWEREKLGFVEYHEILKLACKLVTDGTGIEFVRPIAEGERLHLLDMIEGKKEATK